MLMVVAVVSTITAGAFVMVGNITDAAGNTKLRRDVTVINTAIRTYLVNGGTFLPGDLSDPATLLAKLKRRASADSARQLAGLRGSMADARLTFEMQTAAEAVDGVERARFIADPANPRFVVQNDGPPGIRRFVKDASLAEQDFGTEERQTTMKLAKRDSWVWDYSDSGVGREIPGTPPQANPAATNPEPAEAANIALNPPAFSVPSGKLPLTSFPMELALLPSNPSGTSQILYSVDNGPFAYYTGTITVEPGSTITAMSASLDPDRYDDSPASGAHTYTTTPVTPEPLLNFARSGYTYFELGGPAAPGTPLPLPEGSVQGTGALSNAGSIPVAYQSSSVFRFVWTLDGSNPLTSPAAQSQPDFSGGFNPALIPLPLAAFNGAASVTVHSAVKSDNKTLVTDSAVVSATVAAVAVTLRDPLITVDGRDVTLSFDLSARDVPQDARIFFTTDGTDPGVDAAGNPLRGTLYTGQPIALDGNTGSQQSVMARAYAPPAYRQFFHASGTASVELVLPADTAIYVGGSFVNSGGNAMRNIARLDNSGQVDGRFNTGSGASGNSLVGVVRQVPGGVMAGGDFHSVNGAARNGIVRLHASGAVDAGFDAGLTAN